MTESENSWSIEELVTRMEEMLSEINNLKSEKQTLIVQKQSLLSEKEDLMTSNRRQEEQIRQLSSEISSLQSVLQELKKELQTKSEQIVKLKSADLVLKENEQLKETDKRREKELCEIRRKSEETISACRESYKEKAENLDHLTSLKDKELSDYKQMTANQKVLIENAANKKYNTYKTDLDKKYAKNQKKLESEYNKKNEILTSKLLGCILYAITITLLAAIGSDTFLKDLMGFFDNLAGTIERYISLVTDAGESVASICLSSGSSVIQTILYTLIVTVVSLCIIILSGLISYFPIRRYIRWYKNKIADSLSLWVAVITFIATIFLADEIKSFLPVNLITLNLIAHLVYSGGRAYIEINKADRGYY